MGFSYTTYISVAVASLLSLVGCLIIILLYLRHKELRKAGYQLIAYLLIFDILHCFAFLLPTYNKSHKDLLCIFQAQILTIITLANVIWTNIISIFLYLMIVKRKKFDNKITKIFIIVLLFCTLLSFLPLTVKDDYNSYAVNTGWCWLSDSDLKFVLLYAPLWIIITANTIIYIYVIKHIKSECEFFTELSSASEKLIKKLRLYPAVLIISFLPVTILRITETLGEAHIDSHLTIAAGIFVCLNGFFNSLIYGCTMSTRQILFPSPSSSRSYPLPNLAEKPLPN